VLNRHSTLILLTLASVALLQITLAYAVTNPVVPPGFVELTGPHGLSVIIGPLIHLPNGGYEREVIIPGRQPFMVSTEPGVTPQEVADIYG